MKNMLSRVNSIDVFRAVTMFLMVFINDLDGVAGIPEEWKHASATEDRLGFADTIFPAFLFIVGLSLPFAIEGRIRKNKPVISHILLRTLALLVMGFYHVNLESFGTGGPISRPVWEIIITIGFFFIWLDYDRAIPWSRRLIFQGIGVALLVSMAFFYKNEAGEIGITAMHTSWWGILGLIGWSYLIGACLYYFSKGRLALLIISWLFMFTFNLAWQLGWLQSLHGIQKFIWISSNGGLPSLVLAGAIVAVSYNRFIQVKKLNQWSLWMLVAAILLFIIGFLLRPYGGISKIHGTPSWIAICTAISLLVYLLFVYLADVANLSGIFKWLQPAGTATLTCYLIPYLLYPLLELLHFSYPSFLSEGIGGFLRSVLVACICVGITALLEKRRWKLKI